jgi:hypothetical protein
MERRYEKGLLGNFSNLCFIAQSDGETAMSGNIDTLYDNDREASQHRIAIERISSATGKSFQDIQAVYETALRDFKRRARFKDYLLILVTRKVESVVRT